MSSDFPDWNAPTSEMMAAVKLARLCSERGGMNEIMFAEWVLAAKESLWYLQAVDWSESPPDDLLKDDLARSMFKRGMSQVVQIVDLGYDDEHGWWYLPKLWRSKVDQQMGILELMDTAIMLERIKEIPIWPEDREMIGYATTVVPTFLVVSAGFWPFFSLICGPRWRQRFEAFMRGAAEAKRIRIGDGRKQRRR